MACCSARSATWRWYLRFFFAASLAFILARFCARVSSSAAVGFATAAHTKGVVIEALVTALNQCRSYRHKLLPPQYTTSIAAFLLLSDHRRFQPTEQLPIQAVMGGGALV